MQISIPGTVGMENKLNIRKIIIARFFLILLACTLVMKKDINADSRTLAMGGAYIAIGEDASAQSINPAGIHNAEEREFRIIDLTLTGEMVGLYNNLVLISSAVTKARETEEAGSYIDFDMLDMFAEGMQAVEYVGEYEGGVMTDNVLGSMQLSLGNPTISINPHIYLGISPMMNMGSLTSGDLKITTGTLNFDFSLIPASTGTPSLTLIDARDNIAGFIDALVRAGAQTGELSNEQVANAIINQARDGGIPDDGIIIVAGDAEKLLPLFESLYIIFTSTSPELYFADYEMGLIIKNLNTVEISFGFTEHFETFRGTVLEGLIMGINLKYIMGETAYRRLNFNEMQHVQDSDFELCPEEGDKAQSSAIGIDIGFLYDRKEQWGTRFALAFTNINTPKFKPPPKAEPYGEKYELYPTGKFGVAFWPADFLTVAADIDLIKAQHSLRISIIKCWQREQNFMC